MNMKKLDFMLSMLAQIQNITPAVVKSALIGLGGILVIVTDTHGRWAIKNRIDGDCMICMGTYRNGVMTGMKGIIIVLVLCQIRMVLQINCTHKLFEVVISAVLQNPADRHTEQTMKRNGVPKRVW